MAAFSFEMVLFFFFCTSLSQLLFLFINCSKFFFFSDFSDHLVFRDRRFAIDELLTNSVTTVLKFD